MEAGDGKASFILSQGYKLCDIAAWQKAGGKGVWASQSREKGGDIFILTVLRRYAAPLRHQFRLFTSELSIKTLRLCNLSQGPQTLIL